MKLVLTDESWILDDLNPIEWRFLSQLPGLAGGGEFSEENRKRLRPNPVAEAGDGPTGSGEAEFLRDWREFVEPDLDRLFSDARDRVAEDLNQASEEAAAGNLPERIEIPNSHSEPWYSVINQARLLMNEAHGLAQATEQFGPLDPGETESDVEQFLRLAQYEFYTAVQSILIEHRMKP